MGLFQKSVLKKYLKGIDEKQVNEAWERFKGHFHNFAIQENIRKSKEEQHQGEFLIDLFVKVLEYTNYPLENYNLIREQKNVKDAKSADGAIIKDGKIIAVIELKGTNTTDLGKIESQAFGYKNNQPDAVYVITSNFEKLRFYIDNAVDFEDFNLFELSKEGFQLLWLCLSKESIFQDIPKQIKNESLSAEETITKKLYKDYSNFRRDIFTDIVKNNPHYDKLTLFNKTQKLLDRFLFLFFAEDRLLLPPNSIREIINQWTDLRDHFDEYQPLYNRFIKYFGYLNTGHKGKKHEIFAYNGGLFLPDEILDNIKIDDRLLYKHTLNLSEYDFESEVSVNILGHIFEHSLSEIEEIQAELEGQIVDKNKTKRKKDGVFYTPKYITKYIVDNTVGGLCKQKKTELGIIEKEYEQERTGKQNKAKIKALQDKLEQYRNWLLKITICDPACGSGAFLNQALEFLITEHRYIDELQAKLFGDRFVFQNIENSILENNLFGVDINDESIEIAKLSLWIRTAQKGRKLTSLNNNIKCGNSLIDDPEVAGGFAFNWKEQFPAVFANGGFDVVIGNPPYGAFISDVDKRFYQTKYKVFQGNYEIYFFFIELCGKLTKPASKIGYITPDTWINIPQARNLREHVLNLYGINHILTFNFSVFTDASVNPIIFILTNAEKSMPCEVIHVESDNFDLSNKSLLNVSEWKISSDNQFHIWFKNGDKSIIDKIVKTSVPAVTFLDISQGIVPYSTENLSKEDVKNRIYHSNKPLTAEYGRWIQGRSINRYSIDLTKEEYVKYGNWLHRARKPKYFTSNRILIQEITGGNPPRISAVGYDKELYHDPGIISCINISNLATNYLLAVINSKLISWYTLKVSPKGKRTTFPKVLIEDIRRFPIIDAGSEFQQPLIEFVDIMNNLNKDLSKLQTLFIDLIQSKFDLIKISGKLCMWYEMDFKAFLQELKKVKVQISLHETTEWMQYFNEQKQKVQELKLEIGRVDNQIDQFIYQLYKLTPEEIQIVEGQ